MKKKAFLAMLTTLVCALPASWGEGKVTICHFPPGNPANVQILTIGSSAVSHHIGNHAGDRVALAGDTCGPVGAPPGDGQDPG